MARKIKISLFSLLSIVILATMLGCKSGVSQQEYDAVKAELETVKGQVAALQSQLNAANLGDAQYQALNTRYEDLQKQYETQTAAIQTAQANYDDLNTRYSELNDKFADLQSKYDAMISGTTALKEDEIDQTIFAIINAERRKAGVPELQWGVNLYGLALQNSKEMAALGKYHYSSLGGVYQNVFWAIRYGTVEQVANAALITWTVNVYDYENVLINDLNTYGAVGTYKSGEIYYITFMSSIYK
ncbi:MAG: CAP domain-containing protein [Chloroflexota bacterium]